MSTPWSASNISSPAYIYKAITPSDSVNVVGLFKSIYVGGAGNAAVVAMDDTVVTFVGLVAGSIIPIIGKRINSTNTTATFLVALQ